tara:strand:+ start:910 stop:1479 length:570 start_codon:yes stop_codon:yes gene_type:complete
MAIDLHKHSAQEASNITSRRAVIRVTPTITGVQYSNNDVLFTTTEIPEAVGYSGGASKLINITINSKSASLFDCTMWFFQANQSAGTVNGAWNMSDSDFGSAKNLGCIYIDGDNLQQNPGGGRVYTIMEGYSGFTSKTKTYPQLPLMLQAESGSTSVYVAAKIQSEDDPGNTTPSFSVGDIELVFGIDY